MLARRLPITSSLLLTVLLLTVFLFSGCATSGQFSENDRKSIAGKTYVVTGASSGFGRGVALKLAPLGANVVLAARRVDVLNELAEHVRAAGGTPLVVATDVSKFEDMERLADETVKRFGSIDVWINNAGVGAIGRFEDIPVKDHAKLIDVNLKGVIYGSHLALQQFRFQGFGTLVNIGSVESEVPLAYQASYAASKAGVLSLGRALNEEIRLAGMNRIKVATVLPWAASTPFFEHTANYSGNTTQMIALDDPQKVVNAIVWVSLHPREELAVGWKAKAAYASHRLFPDLTEYISANIYHKLQMEGAPPAPPTSGNLHAPVQAGKTVEGDIRKRMEQEETLRRQGKQ